jgi:hypothetical protein
MKKTKKILQLFIASLLNSYFGGNMIMASHPTCRHCFGHLVLVVAIL